MKKIFLLLAVVGGMFLTGCEGPQGPQGPAGVNVEAETFEIRNVNFIPDGSGYAGIIYDLNPAILASDMILVYRLAGVANNGDDIWEPMPQTYYFNNGEELDIRFDFTQRDIQIYLDYTDPSVLIPQYTQNQIFRVVVVPGYFTNKISDTSYNAVKDVLKFSDADFTERTASRTE